MKVLITNAIALNGGDAAILHATIGILQRHFGDDIDITVHDMSADASRRYYPCIRFRKDIYSEVALWSHGRVKPAIAALAVIAMARMHDMPLVPAVARRLLPRSLRDTLADYAAADLVVSSGGTYLVPHYSMTSKLLDFLVAQALGKPLILFTQSLGPFPPARHRPVLRHVLHRAKLILVRDERSRRHLEELQIPAAQVRLCADAAFALAPADLEGRAFPPSRKPWRIAISVRDWPHFSSGSGGSGMDRYFATIATLAGALLEQHDAEVTFISTCQGTPEYWTDDSRTAKEVCNRLPEQLRSRVVIDRQFRRPDELIAALSTFDLTVATRLHAAILSLCAGTPVLPISYEFKTTELFRRFGLGEAVIDVENISPERILGAFRKATAFWSDRAQDTWAMVRAERASAFDAAMHIANVLEPGLPGMEMHAEDREDAEHVAPPLARRRAL